MSIGNSARYWGRGGLVLLCLSVRLAALRADPPSWLSWSTGLYTDEGFYTLDARHEALFGTLAPGDFHDRLLSPLLSILQQGVFAVVGPGLLQARLICVVFGLLTVWLLWRGLRRAYDERTADLGALFLGLAPPFVFCNRMALQETPTVFWLVLAFALWTHPSRASKFASGAAFALAVVFKGLALMTLPVMLVRPTPNPLPRGEGATLADGDSLSSPLGRTPANEERMKQGGGFLAQRGGFLLACALYAAFWYGPHHAELTHMATYYRVHQMQPHSALSLWLNLRRGLIGGERGVVPYLLALMPVSCLLAGWGIAKNRVKTQSDKYLTIWLACGLLFCLLSSYAPSRYYVLLLLPPLAGLAARGLAGWKCNAQIAFIGLFLLTNGIWYGAAWMGRTETERDAGSRLVRLLPVGSIVIGEFAPTLCLDTPFAAAPVQPGLSNDDHPAERLQATDIVVTQTPFWQNWWRERYPDIVQPSHKIATLQLGGWRHYVVDVYAVKSAGK